MSQQHRNPGRVTGLLIAVTVFGTIALDGATSKTVAQPLPPAGTPPAASSPADPRAGLSGTIGSNVPISGGLKRQPGGGGTDGLPDPTSSAAARSTRVITVSPNAPPVAAHDLTGAPLPNPGAAPDAPGSGARTTPAPGR